MGRQAPISRMRASLAGLAVLILCATATVMHYHHHDSQGHVCFLWSTAHEDSHCNHCENAPGNHSDCDNDAECGLHLYQILATQDDHLVSIGANGVKSHGDVGNLAVITDDVSRVIFDFSRYDAGRTEFRLMLKQIVNDVTRRGPPAHREI